jgi:hypothetical protein
MRGVIFGARAGEAGAAPRGAARRLALGRVQTDSGRRVAPGVAAGGQETVGALGNASKGAAPARAGGAASGSSGLPKRAGVGWRGGSAGEGKGGCARRPPRRARGGRAASEGAGGPLAGWGQERVGGAGPLGRPALGGVGRGGGGFGGDACAEPRRGSGLGLGARCGLGRAARIARLCLVAETGGRDAREKGPTGRGAKGGATAADAAVACAGPQQGRRGRSGCGGGDAPRGAAPGPQPSRLAGAVAGASGRVPQYRWCRAGGAAAAGGRPAGSGKGGGTGETTAAGQRAARGLRGGPGVAEGRAPTFGLQTRAGARQGSKRHRGGCVRAPRRTTAGAMGRRHGPGAAGRGATGTRTRRARGGGVACLWVCRGQGGLISGAGGRGEGASSSHMGDCTRFSAQHLGRHRGGGWPRGGGGKAGRQAKWRGRACGPRAAGGTPRAGRRAPRRRLQNSKHREV